LILDGVAGLKFLSDGQSKHLLAVLRAHLHFYRMLSRFKSKRKANLQASTQNAISEIYQKKVVFEHFLHKKRKYSDL
jgi:hypothetical protein